MNIKNLRSIYFSPTGTTKKVVKAVGKAILENIDLTYKEINYTAKEVRVKEFVFDENDIVIIGIPVYAGRVPNILLKSLKNIKGKNTFCICIVLYGNRNYDDALIELRDIMKTNGFNVMAAAAFIGEHSFSYELAKDRPNSDDIVVAKNFGVEISNKILNKDAIYNELFVKGNTPYRDYFKPRDRNNNIFDFRLVKPKTDMEKCIDCKICYKVCPMRAIDYHNVSEVPGICIKCGACEKRCPTGAKYYDDENYLKHKYELEDECSSYKEIELFI